MSNTKQKIVTAVVTLAVAAGVGHVTQYGLSGLGSASAVSTTPVEDDGFTPIPTRTDNMLLKVRQPVFPAPTSDTLRHDVPGLAAPLREALHLPAHAPIRISAPVFAPDRPPSDAEINLNGFGIACRTEHSVSAELGGVIRLRVTSACAPGARVDVTHAGLSFSGLTDAQGLFDTAIPAMTEAAEITYRIEGGAPVTAEIDVPDASAFTRVALAWGAGADLSLHALEFGAGPGSAGHVALGRRATVDTAGRVVRLGDPAIEDSGQVEIYSFPAGRARSGTIRLAAAVRVTEATCGNPIDLVSLQRAGDGIPLERRHTVPLPGCADVGDILVLKNILDDLKIAGN
ncbi:hypothetical protein [Ovoidimarina sediminis]|uniref:hypothetical protein n=1 Tax=Ovoidimarina sediminis TaxID=3079856 RepID=UPI0029156F93|nr:hypothetical protein [Rhodophyticola sp. MJ-SS7]MDU8942411.1 hypothetical protein [Rhodophyticola sp. MJ-SS7]